MATNPNQREAAKVLIRLPRGLHEKLKATAAEQGVSVNTFLVALLSGALRWEPEWPEAEDDADDWPSEEQEAHAA